MHTAVKSLADFVGTFKKMNFRTNANFADDSDDYSRAPRIKVHLKLTF